MLLVFLASLARAEGSEQLGGQRLEPDTVVRVDILEPSNETIRWTANDVDGVPYGALVEDPTGVSLGRIESGESITPTVAGAYTLMADTTAPVHTWDITVDGAPDDKGRVWSDAWRFWSGDWVESSAVTASFYVVVDDGTGSTAVVELHATGLAGNVYSVKASDVGVAGSNGRSTLIADAPRSAPGQYPVYLKPPEDADYAATPPSLTDASVHGDGAGECVAAGVVGGSFEFTVDRDATYHLNCDLDGDGTADPSDDADLQLSGRATAGLNVVDWDGRNNVGNVVPVGTYTCRIVITTGEVHFVAEDIESFYGGLRVFHVDSERERAALAMYWNDADVQANELRPMPNGLTALENSGPNGLSSGSYEDPTDPNVNARAWGDFPADGTGTKGDLAYLDTYAWLYEDVSASLQVRVGDLTVDTDLDGLVDGEEECLLGSDPNDADSDDDLVPDGIEARDGAADTDGDGILDVLDPDDDGDGVPTADEDANGDGDPSNDDSDGDGIPDYLDDLQDRDGDGWATDEDCNDDDASIYPGAPEALDGIDSDCDGVAESLDTGDTGPADTGSVDTGSVDTATTDTAGTDSGGGDSAPWIDVDKDTGAARRGECGCSTGASGLPSGAAAFALLLLAGHARRRPRA